MIGVLKKREKICFPMIYLVIGIFFAIILIFSFLLNQKKKRQTSSAKAQDILQCSPINKCDANRDLFWIKKVGNDLYQCQQDGCYHSYKEVGSSQDIYEKKTWKGEGKKAKVNVIVKMENCDFDRDNAPLKVFNLTLIIKPKIESGEDLGFVSYRTYRTSSFSELFDVTIPKSINDNVSLRSGVAFWHVFYWTKIGEDNKQYTHWEPGFLPHYDSSVTGSINEYEVPLDKPEKFINFPLSKNMATLNYSSLNEGEIFNLKHYFDCRFPPIAGMTDVQAKNRFGLWIATRKEGTDWIGKDSFNHFFDFIKVFPDVDLKMFTAYDMYIKKFPAATDEEYKRFVDWLKSHTDWKETDLNQWIDDQLPK